MKEKIILLFIGLLVFQGSYSQPAEVSRHSWADSVLHQMSLDEKIGQLFMIAAYSNKNENYENELEKTNPAISRRRAHFFPGETRLSKSN